jgi:hypothetical protein
MSHAGAEYSMPKRLPVGVKKISGNEMWNGHWLAVVMMVFSVLKNSTLRGLC